MNWYEELVWSSGTAPSLPATIGVHVARKHRAPTIGELLIMVGTGVAFDIAMYKMFGAAYGEIRLYVAANTFINVKKSADLGTVVFRGTKLIPALVTAGGVYYAGRKAVQYAQKKNVRGLLSTTHEETSEENETTRSGGVRNPISGV